jgi:hypothetical protein
VTLVAASDYYSFTDEVNNQGATIAIGGECGLQGTNALCTILGDSTEVVTKSVATLVLDLGNATPTHNPNSSRRISYPVFMAIIIMSLPLAYQLV